jgi:hypothetical protein
VKRAEEAMEILEAYDLTGSLRGAAALAGCDHKTVKHWVEVREQAGEQLPGQAARPTFVMVEPFAGKVAELVDHSHARVRADKAHGVLVAMGYDGRIARPGGRSPKRSDGGGTSMGGGRGRGSRSRGSGCSGTTGTGPRSRACARCCSARG